MKRNLFAAFFVAASCLATACHQPITSADDAQLVVDQLQQLGNAFLARPDDQHPVATARDVDCEKGEASVTITHWDVPRADNDHQDVHWEVDFQQCELGLATLEGAVRYEHFYKRKGSNVQAARRMTTNDLDFRSTFAGVIDADVGFSMDTGAIFNPGKPSFALHGELTADGETFDLTGSTMEVTSSPTF